MHLPVKSFLEFLVPEAVHPVVVFVGTAAFNTKCPGRGIYSIEALGLL
jgi:hypothetical protein